MRTCPKQRHHPASPMQAQEKWNRHPEATSLKLRNKVKNTTVFNGIFR
jgi:hypothetical protein